MLVSELTGSWSNSLIASSPLWNRQIDAIKPLDLQVFLRTHWGTPHYNEALRQVEALIDQSWNAMLRSETPPPPMVYFDVPNRPRITVDELASWLMEVSVARRRAILFMLETGMDAGEAIGLTWSKLRRMTDLSQFALLIAQSNPRHIRIEYVFWEPTPNMSAAPLFGLGESALQVSQGMGLKALRRLYETMIPAHQEAERDAFIDSVCYEINHRITPKN